MSWQWFALKVAPGKEFAAERILRDNGFDVFTPLKHIPSRRSDKEVIARPRFVGYVFIGFDHPDIPWLDVRRFRMIIGVISDNGEPYAFPEEVIREIAVRSSRPIKLWGLGKNRKRKRPNAARVTNGPYAGRHVRYLDLAEESDIYELVEPHLAKSEDVA